MRTGHAVICSSLTRIKLFALLFKGKATAKQAICLPQQLILGVCTGDILGSVCIAFKWQYVGASSDVIPSGVIFDFSKLLLEITFSL